MDVYGARWFQVDIWMAISEGPTYRRKTLSLRCSCPLSKTHTSQGLPIIVHKKSQHVAALAPACCRTRRNAKQSGLWSFFLLRPLPVALVIGSLLWEELQGVTFFAGEVRSLVRCHATNKPIRHSKNGHGS